MGWPIATTATGGIKAISHASMDAPALRHGLSAADHPIAQVIPPTTPAANHNAMPMLMPPSNQVAMNDGPAREVANT
jgi:hypothetical protein